MVNQTPLKRPRTEGLSAKNKPGNYTLNDQTIIHIRQVLSQLQQAITSKQRETTLHQLLNIIGYDPSTRACRCNSVILSRLLEGKCIHLLCLQLGYVLSRRNFGWEHDLRTKYPNEEVLLILIAFDAFYRHCSELISEDSVRSNGPELLRLLQDFLSQHLGGLGGGNIDGRRGSDTFSFVQPIISIWHHFSSCSLGTILLLQNPRALQALGIILSAERNQALQCDVRNVEMIMECLGLLKNLTYYGEDYRHLIVNQSGLISTLTSLTDIPNNKTRERLSAVFRNLALSSDVRIRLTQRADVLTALVRMANFCLPETIPLIMKATANVDDSKCKKNTIRNILSTITSLSIDTNMTHLIVFHGDGVLVEQLKQLVVHCDDFVSQKRAIRAIGLLARDPSSTPVMVLQNNQLLEILLDRALNDANDSVRAEATEAISKFAYLIRAPMAEHNSILDALTRMLMTATKKSPIVTTRNVDTVVRAIQEQGNHHINRKAMTQHPDLLRSLADVIRSNYCTLSAKESACATLVKLSEDETCQEAIALPMILDTLVKTLAYQPRARTSNDITANAGINIDAIVMDRIRESSVRIMLNLSMTPSNRKNMAQQTKLIQSLLRFAATATTSEDVKKQVKTAILQLAAEL